MSMNTEHARAPWKRPTSRSIEIVPVSTGNPFADHPQLREIWPAERTALVESNTVERLANPQGGRVFLIRKGSGVVGITGYFLDDEETIGLRWHGIVPEWRGHGYSRVTFRSLCDAALVEHAGATSIVELVPAYRLGELASYFESLGFVRDGDPREGGSLPPGLWHQFRFAGHPFSHVRSLKDTVGKFCDPRKQKSFEVEYDNRDGQSRFRFSVLAMIHQVEPGDTAALDYCKNESLSPIPGDLPVPVAFVARRSDGQILGRVIVGHEGDPAYRYGDRPWIGGVFVEEDVRHQGIGRRLVDTAIEYCRAAGARSVCLDSVKSGEWYAKTWGFAHSHAVPWSDTETQVYQLVLHPT